VGHDSRGRKSGLSRLMWLVGLGFVVATSAVAIPLPASAATGIGVFVGYADSLRANATNFPTPWAGSPNTIFEGCPSTAACSFDAGAVQVINNSGAAVTVNSIAVHLGSCTFTGWPSAVLPNHGSLIVTQIDAVASEGCSGPASFDSSDIGIKPNCVPDGIVPVVDVTINGTTTTAYADSGQVLNTGGVDYGACSTNASRNESIQWTKIGSAPCRGSLLGLAPPTQTHGVGTMASVTATFTNSCNQPLQNVSVQFKVLSGPNGGLTGTGTTDASGQATFTYTGTMAGTDTLQASVTNVIGTLTSNQVTVRWVVFAPGGGAFVISDLKDINGHAVYWWGAQWWKNDHLSSGLAPAAFKGFENGNASPWCGQQTWTTRPGNSSKPPRTVPTYMAVIVAAHVTKRGPMISGDIVHIVIVRTNSGYGPNPGHIGTGTIVETLC
jgi:Bacterial Ig-like domain (group 1)